MLVWITVVPIAVSLPIVVIAVARPGLRRLAVRNALGRPAQSLLVIAGVVVAAAIVTSAGVVGDSWRASVRQSAFTQLGPVDEEIRSAGLTGTQIAAAVDRSRPDGVDGTLPLVALSATVRGRDFVARVAEAQVLELDFAAAKNFGGDPSVTGIDGPTPAGDTAVMSADLSHSIAIAPRHRVTVYAYGRSRTFRVARVVPRRGIAGLAAVTGPVRGTSLNLFVPPGTIASMMRAGATSAGSAQPVSVLAVSNAGGVIDDRHRAETVTAALRDSTRNVDAEVVPVKQQTLADADARSRHFTSLFRAFGFLSALGGILLLALVLLIVTRDRVRSMAILRAQGLRRGGVVAALSLEGWGAAVLGIALGALAGAGLAALVVILARDLAGLESSGGTELEVSIRASSVALGCVLAFVAATLVVVSSAAIAARGNIASQMREGSPAGFGPEQRIRVAMGAFGCAAGAAITIVGIGVENLAASVLGPAIAGAGLVAWAYTPRRARPLVSIGAGAVFAWSLLALYVVGDRVVSASALVAEGIVLTVSGVAFAAVNQSSITRRFGKRGRKGVPVELGLAYATTDRRRGTLTTAMYAMVLFTLALLLTIARVYERGIDNTARRLGGASALEVTSNVSSPVPVADVRSELGVEAVTEAAAANLRLTTSSDATALPKDVIAVGFDDTFVGHGSPPLAERAPGLNSDDAVFRVVARDPTKVIVGVDLDADAVSGFPETRPHLGDVVHVRDPEDGASRALTVAGIARATRYSGRPHIYLARTAVDAVSGAPGTSNLLFVQTAPGTNNDTLSAVIDGTHLQNGTYARSFVRLARETLSTEEQFLNLAAAYAAVGLIAVLLGIAVLMTDRVRARRRQTAMLRALGFPSRSLVRASRIEALAIMLEGCAVGTLSGVLVAALLASSGRLGSSLSVAIPFASLIAVVVAVLLSSLLAAGLATRPVVRQLPAAALRDER